MRRWVAVFLTAALSCRQSDTAKSRLESVRSGVHVPLPDNWRVQVAEGENFRAGPPGRAVLRIDSSPMKSPIPSAKDLETRLKREDPSLSVQMIDSIEKQDTAIGVFRLTGSGRPAFYAMLGVRRVQGQVFLCSTVPGAPQGDVHLAAEACANFSLRETPLPLAGGGKG